MIRWPAPPDVYVDTGTFIAAIFPNTSDSDAAHTFCDELIMSGSRVYSSDAMHLATAWSAGLAYLATTDADFRRGRSPRVLLIRDGIQ